MVTKNIIDVRECWLLWMFDGNGNEDIELVTTLTGCVHRLEHHGYKLPNERLVLECIIRDFEYKAVHPHHPEQYAMLIRETVNEYTGGTRFTTYTAEDLERED